MIVEIISDHGALLGLLTKAEPHLWTGQMAAEGNVSFGKIRDAETMKLLFIVSLFYVRVYPGDHYALEIKDGQVKNVR